MSGRTLIIDFIDKGRSIWEQTSKCTEHKKHQLKSKSDKIHQGKKKKKF